MVHQAPEGVFSNIWVIRLAPDGRASSFAEWWVQHPDPAYRPLKSGARFSKKAAIPSFWSSEAKSR